MSDTRDFYYKGEHGYWQFKTAYERFEKEHGKPNRIIVTPEMHAGYKRFVENVRLKPEEVKDPTYKGVPVVCE